MLSQIHHPQIQMMMSDVKDDKNDVHPPPILTQETKGIR